jgi:hypothetical protein
MLLLELQEWLQVQGKLVLQQLLVLLEIEGRQWL